MKGAAVVLYASGEDDANLYYATRFLTPDPYVFVQAGRRKAIVVSDLELGRARDEARVDEVLPLARVERALRDRGTEKPGPADVIAWLLRRRRRRQAVVPENFPLHVADELRRGGVRVEARSGVFWSERAVKTPDEVRAIEQTQRAVEEAVGAAIEMLRRARIRGSRLVHGGETLTSESLRRVINVALMERDCVARDTIVACGDQGCDPHQRGTGPLRPDRTIIMDVFPRSSRTQYFADMTRTVVRGRASREARRLFEAVREVQEHGLSRVRAGADGKAIHDELREAFRGLGYRTGPRDGKPLDSARGKMEGFFHGTGHGVGLDIHEAPWITPRGTKLPEGAVVTVEPGLYYFGVGGVRLEDMVVVTKSGCRNLTRFPKFLEV